jgi:hypothetical protein
MCMLLQQRATLFCTLLLTMMMPILSGSCCKLAQIQQPVMKRSRLLLTIGTFNTINGSVMLMNAVTAAAFYGHLECVTIIMTAPVWQAPGMQAARRGAEAVLLHAAKDVAIIDESLKYITDVQAAVFCELATTGYSVLHTAVVAGKSMQVMCKLLKLGADPLAKDADRQTPADLARSKGQTLIAQLLDRAAQDARAAAIGTTD